VLHKKTERFTLTTNIDMNKKLFGYRFTITSNQNGSTLGTGFMTSSKALDETEQKDLFHNWTHGKYLKSENYVSVSVFQADH
jgi:flavin-dependent dehydrogenase